MSRGSPPSVRTYERDKRLLLAKTLALSQKRFFESQTRVIQGPAWKARATLRADHHRRLIPHGTPESRVVAELSVRACTLREQHPGARARAPHQKGADIERRPRLRRMDDGALADANKAEAATTNKLKLAS